MEIIFEARKPEHGHQGGMGGNSGSVGSGPFEVDLFLQGQAHQVTAECVQAHFNGSQPHPVPVAQQAAAA